MSRACSQRFKFTAAVLKWQRTEKEVREGERREEGERERGGERDRERERERE